MKRRTKTLGLALIAVLALGAVSATGSQAAVFTADAYPATLTGKDVNTEHGKLTRITIGNGALHVECTLVTLSATISGPTTEVDFTPTYGECFARGLTTVPVTFTMNGCLYRIHATTTTAGQTTIVCPAGQQIEIHVYENATKHAENKPICTYDIPAQGPITGIKISPTNPGAANEGIKLDFAALSKFNVTSTMGPLSICGVNATSGHAATTGSARGEYVVTGKSGGVDTKVMLEH
ncbi:MAG TPA: hypothetical protein VEW07_07915 [Solirubrobacterales bacterium]|nr:hypothetical protein [Solirubrobacterales bacterium]